MPIIITRAAEGRSAMRLGEYKTLPEAAQALATALKTYSEYWSDPDRQCWWAKDKLGRTYRFEARFHAGDPV
jgi:hypothetical protein